MGSNLLGIDDDWDDAIEPKSDGKGLFDNIPPEPETDPAYSEPDPEEVADAGGIPAATEQTPAPPEPAAPQASPEPTPADAQQPGETVQEWQSRLVGEGRKFSDAQALETAYENLSLTLGQQGQRLGETEARNRDLQELLARTAQMMQAQPVEVPVDANLLRMAEQAGWDSEQLNLAQQLAAQQADARMRQLQGQWFQAEQQRQQATAAAVDQQRMQSEAAVFQQAHPSEFASPQQIVTDLQLTWDQLDVWEDDPMPITARNLEVAYEARSNAELLKVLVAAPDLRDTDQGMDLARRLAAGTPGTTPAPAGATPGARLPHVETAGRGPAPAAAERDEWEVVKLARAEKSNPSPLGI